MVRINSLTAVLASLAALPTSHAVNTSPASAFVADDKSVTFALNIPSDNDNNDLYFTMSGPSSCSWISVGMGSQKMDNSLMFMMYADSTKKNITLSPRLSYGHVEPSYASSITVHVLAGSGISNNTMTVNAMCENCRSWKGGEINPNNTQADFIWANGPSGGLDTNSLTAGIERHADYGVFRMDLTKAVGNAGVPIAVTADSTGSTQVSYSSDNDFAPLAHGIIMILAFVGLMPLGVIILRFLNSPKWHGYNQGLSFVIGLLGIFLGIYISTMYNRSKGFNSAHQVFGLVITVAMIAQFVIGFWHHRIYKKTLATTKLAPIHVWLGRVVIPCGIANGFLGFPLGLDSKYNWALLACILAVAFILTPFAIWTRRKNAVQKRRALAVDESDLSGYQTPAGNSRMDINLSRINPPPGYQSQSHQQYGQFFEG